MRVGYKKKNALVKARLDTWLGANPLEVDGTDPAADRADDDEGDHVAEHHLHAEKLVVLRDEAVPMPTHDVLSSPIRIFPKRAWVRGRTRYPTPASYKINLFRSATPKPHAASLQGS